MVNGDDDAQAVADFFFTRSWVPISESRPKTPPSSIAAMATRVG